MLLLDSLFGYTDKDITMRWCWLGSVLWKFKFALTHYSLHNICDLAAAIKYQKTTDDVYKLYDACLD